MHSLNEKLAVITGGTSGIGLEVAKNFVASGARVIICSRSGNTALADEIGATFFTLDVADEQQVMDLLAAVEKMFGKIDVLVNNAGIALDLDSIETADSADMKKIVEINTYGVWYAMKYAPAHMREGGSIINTGSVAGSGTTSAGNAEYSLSKAAVAYITRTAAIELGDRGIRVNAVCPGLIAGTGMMAEDDGGPTARFCRTLTALGRMGRLDEVAGIYNFLASDSSSFITGQEICIDGGMTAGRSKFTAGAIADGLGL